MCGSPSAPTPPPAAPAAPRAPDVSGKLGDSDKRRKALASGESSRSTILTSSRGVTDGASVAQKTLLGQ